MSNHDWPTNSGCGGCCGGGCHKDNQPTKEEQTEEKGCGNCGGGCEGDCNKDE